MRQIKSAILSTLDALGYELRKKPASGEASKPEGYPNLAPAPILTRVVQLPEGARKAHYGSGGLLFGDNWINIDLPSEIPTPNGEIYISADLAGRHPLPDDFLDYGFSEDFLEHLHQDQSISFLCECYRTLKKGGVVRLSFPGFRQVLREHFRRSDFEGAAVGRREAYTMWGHHHFYSEESLACAAYHVGFRDVRFLSYCESAHTILGGLDSRVEQRNLNIYSELTK